MKNQYSVTERAIAKLLWNFPRVKQFSKKLYQIINFFIYREKYLAKSAYQIIPSRDDNNEYFFGYYDKSPLNYTNQFLLLHKSQIPTYKLPSAESPVKVVLYDFVNKRELNSWESYTYNWQQGTRLQWISKFKFIFNSINSRNIYCSHIVDALNCEIIKTIEFPIYDTCQNYALSLNFDRLNLLRPDYGYRNHFSEAINLKAVDNDGIFKIDIDSGKVVLIKSISEIVNFQPQNKMLQRNIIHKVNHIMISPNGENFIFLHRYYNSHNKHDRLILCDQDGKNMKILSDQQMVSHCCWFDNNTIIAYMRRYNQGDKYYKIDLITGSVTPYGSGAIDKFGDGHPSCYNGNMVFDTYPNKARMKSLFKFDGSLGLHLLGEFYESFKFGGETRCDLHPRFSFDGKKVFFDSVHTGKRMLYYIQIGSND